MSNYGNSTSHETPERTDHPCRLGGVLRRNGAILPRTAATPSTMTTTYIVRFTESTGKPWSVHVNAKDEAEAITIVQDRYRWAVNIEVFPR